MQTRTRRPGRSAALLLGRFDVTADERHPCAVVARDDAHEQILARLGDRGRAIEVSDRSGSPRRINASRPRPTSLIDSAHLLPRSRSFVTASFSSASAVAASSSGNRSRVDALRGQRHGRGIRVAALGEEALALARGQSTTSPEGRCHISPHTVKNSAAARVCAEIGCSFPRSSSIHSRTSLKNPEIHQ